MVALWLLAAACGPPLPADAPAPAPIDAGPPVAPTATFPVAPTRAFVQLDRGLYDADSGAFVAGLGGNGGVNGPLFVDATRDAFFIYDDDRLTARIVTRAGESWIARDALANAHVLKALGAFAIVDHGLSTNLQDRLIDSGGHVVIDGLQIAQSAWELPPEHWWRTAIDPLPVPACTDAPTHPCGWINAAGKWLEDQHGSRSFEAGSVWDDDGWLDPDGTVHALALPDVDVTKTTTRGMPLSEGLALVGEAPFEATAIGSTPPGLGTGPGKWRIIDANGSVRGTYVERGRAMIDLTSSPCTDKDRCDYRFHEERAPVRLLDGTQGYLGPDGAFAIGPFPCGAPVLSGPFHDGRAFECVGAEYWMIDATGARIAGPWKPWAVDETGDWNVPSYPGGLFFSEGLAAVPIDGGWGYVDPSGNVVLSGPYVEAWPFHHGFSYVVGADGTSRYIRRDGTETMTAPSTP